MTKNFCDICKKEIDYKNSIQIRGWFHYRSSMYCIDCFQNKKNWNSIHGRLIKETIANAQKSSTISLS